MNKTQPKTSAPTLQSPSASLTGPRTVVAMAYARNDGKKPDWFCNKKEVAFRLNKTVRTVENWMKRGILPYYKIGRSVEFIWSEVEERLQKTCRVSVSNRQRRNA